VSNVQGTNLELLKKFLNLLPIRTDWEQLQEKPVEFQIDATWQVAGVGTVASGTIYFMYSSSLLMIMLIGTMVSGKAYVNQTLLLGPDEFGKFSPVVIKSIQTKRMPVKSVRAGQTAGNFLLLT
jgi:GTPase